MSSSNLFQNATGFEIVGGQFVSGDVHYHGPPALRSNRSISVIPVPPAEPARGPAPIASSDYAESELYCSQLLRRKRGFPLYVPTPQRNLPEQYQRKGVSIGDVGRVTPEGVFDFFFNIFLSADHPINANDVPEDFFPLAPYVPRDIIHLDFDPGNYVSSSSIHEWDLNTVSGEFPGSEFLFACHGPSGAVLALPHGSKLEKLENIEDMRRYAARNAESWYKHINGTRGRGIANSSLYLITGCEKAQSGGIAYFQGVNAEFPLSFKPSTGADAGYKYRFKRGTPALCKTFPSSTQVGERLLNHTTFLHGFTISLGEGIWGRVFGNVGINQITESQMPQSSSGFVPFGSQASTFSWSLGFFSGGGATGGKRYARENGAEAVISELSPTPEIFHPGRLINNYIVLQVPDATAVITHDDDWRDILDETDTICNSREFLVCISDKFMIEADEGIVSLISKSDGTSLEESGSLRCSTVTVDRELQPELPEMDTTLSADLDILGETPLSSGSNNNLKGVLPRQPPRDTRSCKDDSEIAATPELSAVSSNTRRDSFSGTSQDQRAFEGNKKLIYSSPYVSMPTYLRPVDDSEDYKLSTSSGSSRPSSLMDPMSDTSSAMDWEEDTPMSLRHSRSPPPARDQLVGWTQSQPQILASQSAHLPPDQRTFEAADYRTRESLSPPPSFRFNINDLPEQSSAADLQPMDTPANLPANAQEAEIRRLRKKLRGMEQLYEHARERVKTLESRNLHLPLSRPPSNGSSDIAFEASRKARTDARIRQFCALNRAGNALCAWHDTRRERRVYPPHMAPPGYLNCGCTHEEALFEESLARHHVGSYLPGETVRMDPALRNPLLKLLQQRYGYRDGDFEQDPLTRDWMPGEGPALWESQVPAGPTQNLRKNVGNNTKEDSLSVLITGNAQQSSSEYRSLIMF